MSKKRLEYLVLPFVLLSCGLVSRIDEDSETQKLRERGYDPYHAMSCGPKALSDFFSNFDISIKREDLSKEILENSDFGNVLRDFSSVFDKDMLRITWPWEMESMLHKYLGENYDVVKKSGGRNKMKNYLKRMIENGENGIALIKKDFNFVNYHWASFSCLDTPFDFYGDDTRVLRAYTAKEK
jgi:hypothetical protein